MGFDEEKQRYLGELEQIRNGKEDRSKKGGVDAAAWPLIDAINQHPDFYTTSSCAGRIDLFVEPESGKKHEGEWLFVTHEAALSSEVEAALDTLPTATVWFRLEGAIMHICCRSLEAANQLLQWCKESGWKHSGITGAKRRIIIEATTSERIDVPIAAAGELFVEKKFINYLVDEANKKLEKTRKKINRLAALYQ